MYIWFCLLILMCDSTQGHIGIGGTEATAPLVYSLAVVIKLYC